MAKYIDADAFRKMLIDRQITTQFFNPIEREEIGCIIEMLDETTAADVVPSAEVDGLQSQVNRLKKYDEERDIALHARLIAETRQGVAMEIFDEIEKHGRKVQSSDWSGEFWGRGILVSDLAELKKKYTGER